MNPEFRIRWKNAGYSAKCGSAAVVPPPPRKWRRVYYITTLEHGINDIALGRIKLARFSDLNDPFELLAVSFRERPIRKAVRDFKATYDSHTGLLCFSTDWTNPVLWSHYGQKHRGMCLGFKIPRSRLERVKYKDKRLLARLDEETRPAEISNELQKQLLCTKYRHWRYEAEWRIFVPLKDTIPEGRLHFYPFQDDLQLAEVILGPQCDLSLREIRRLTKLRYPDAVTYRARLALKFFSVVPKESTVLQHGSSASLN